METQPAPGLLVIERILRDRDGIWRQINEEDGLRRLTFQMLASSAASLALYGLVLGANYGWAQALSSMVKLPLLFLATLAICLPTLYLFNLVFGARLSVLQAVTLIMVAITVTSVLTLAFAPISLFFLITAHSYAFFKLLNVAILVLTALVGLRFLTGGMRELNAYQERRKEAVNGAAPAAVIPDGTPMVPVQPTGSPVSPAPVGQLPAAHVATLPVHLAPPPGHGPYRLPAAPVPPAARQPASMTLLYIWILLFGFVGTQLGWTLRPFFGSPGEKFQVFRNLDGTFYGDILTTIGRLFHG